MLPASWDGTICRTGALIGDGYQVTRTSKPVVIQADERESVY